LPGGSSADERCSRAKGDHGQEEERYKQEPEGGYDVHRSNFVEIIALGRDKPHRQHKNSKIEAQRGLAPGVVVRQQRLTQKTANPKQCYAQNVVVRVNVGETVQRSQKGQVEQRPRELQPLVGASGAVVAYCAGHHEHAAACDLPILKPPPHGSHSRQRDKAGGNDFFV
jgi:hypothetical protein